MCDRLAPARRKENNVMSLFLNQNANSSIWRDKLILVSKCEYSHWPGFNLNFNLKILMAQWGLFNLLTVN